MEDQRSSALADRELDLLRGTPAMLDVGLLAARCSAAAVRAAVGDKLDEVDRSSLEELAGLLRSAADVVEFFDTEGRSGAYPSGALSQNVDVAVDALLVDTPPNSDPAGMMKYMHALATQIAEFAATGDKAIGDQLAPTFGHLSKVLRARIGRTGETTSRL